MVKDPLAQVVASNISRVSEI